jgi:hypothetical protein
MRQGLSIAADESNLVVAGEYGGCTTSADLNFEGVASGFFSGGGSGQFVVRLED